MKPQAWPDPLEPPDPQRVDELLSTFWRRLGDLAELVPRDEHVLAEECTAALRGIVVEMMLALNGIRRPLHTAHLNGYLSDSQRVALEKTLLAQRVAGQSWLARAVALTVIYRWYAPQLTARFGLKYPSALEADVWQRLVRNVPQWPQTVTTE